MIHGGHRNRCVNEIRQFLGDVVGDRLDLDMLPRSVFEVDFCVQNGAVTKDGYDGGNGHDTSGQDGGSDQRIQAPVIFGQQFERHPEKCRPQVWR